MHWCLSTSPHPARTTQKQQACDSLVEVLGQLPTGFHGNIDPAGYAGLAGLVRKLRITRGDFVGPAFQVGGGVFLSDPIKRMPSGGSLRRSTRQT